MNTLLVQTNDMDIYTNDLVRYYTDDMSSLEFGIVKGYDSYYKRLVVSALNQSRPKIVNVIERYPEEEWKDMTFVRERPDYVTMTIKPFEGIFTIIQKNLLQNSIIKELPYKRIFSISCSHILTQGADNFINELNYTAKNIINNEILHYDLSMHNNADSGVDKRVVDYNFPYHGKLLASYNVITNWDKQTQLKKQVLSEVEDTIKDLMDMSLEDSQYSLTIPKIALPKVGSFKLQNTELFEYDNTDDLKKEILRRIYYIIGHEMIDPNKKTTAETIAKLKELDLPYTGYYSLRLENFESKSGLELANEVNEVVLNSLDYDLLRDQSSRKEMTICNFPKHGHMSIKTSKWDSFTDAYAKKLYALNQVIRIIETRVIGRKTTTEEDLEMYANLHKVQFPLKASKSIQFLSGIGYNDPNLMLTEALDDIENIIDYKVLGKSSPIELAVELPTTFSTTLTMTSIMSKSHGSEVANNMLSAIKDYVNCELTKPIQITNKDLPLTVRRHTTFDQLVAYDPVRLYQECSYIASTYINEYIMSSLDSDVSKTLPRNGMMDIDTSLILLNDTEYFRKTALYKIKSIIDHELVEKYNYNNGAVDAENLPWFNTLDISSLKLLDLTSDQFAKIAIDHVTDFINTHTKELKYSVILNRDALTMPLYINEYPLSETTNSILKIKMQDMFEEILCWLNMNYSSIRTIKPFNPEVEVNMPFIEAIEYIPLDSNAKNKVYRVFIRDNSNIYKAFIMINDRLRFKGIIFAAPHIYSENNMILQQFTQNEDPMIYNHEDYLKSLITFNKKAILDLVKVYQ